MSFFRIILYFHFCIVLITSIQAGQSPFDIKVTDSLGDPYLQEHPEIVFITYSELLVGFDDYREGQPNVYVAKSIDSGSTFINNTKLDAACSTGCITKNVSFQYDRTSDRVFAVYLRKPNLQSTFDVVFAVSYNRGMTWTQFTIVNDDQVYTHEFPCLAFNQLNQTIHVAWTDYREDGSQPRIYYSKSTDGGQTFSVNTRVTNPNLGTGDKKPCIVATAPQFVHIAFETELTFSHISVATSNNNGATFQMPAMINSLGFGNLHSPDMAASSSILHVVYTDDYLGAEKTFLATSMTHGSTFISSIPVTFNSTYNELNPRVQLNYTNDLHVCWEEYLRGNADIGHSVSVNNGLTFRHIFIAHSDISSANQVSPSFIVAPNVNRLNFVWADDRESQTALDIFANYSVPSFYDDFDDDDFQNWTFSTHVKSTPQKNFSQDGFSCQFGEPIVNAKAAGLLTRQYSVQQQGTIDFWFYDGFGTHPDYQTVDFTVTISQDETATAGLPQVLGVVNSYDEDDYAVFDGTAYSLTGIPRSEGWHRVIASIDETGLSIELDPSGYASIQPVFSNVSFTSFSSVRFDGGSGTAPYYLDNVNIVSEELPPIPAMSFFGLLVLCLSMSVIFLINKRK